MSVRGSTIFEFTRVLFVYLTMLSVTEITLRQMTIIAKNKLGRM